MAGLALASGLVAPSAQAGSYTAVGSGGTTASTVTPAADALSSSPQDATGTASVSPMSGNGNPTYTINIKPGTLTTTFTWVPASGQTSTTDPPPTCVLVQQSSFALWYVHSEYGTGTGSGNPDCGLTGGTSTSGTFGGNGPSKSLSATLNSQQSGASFSVSCSPTVSFTGTTGTEGSVEGEAEVGGGASAYPITLTIGGTNNPAAGDYHVLTGQQITATLSGIPTNYTVTKYTWSGQSGTCFKNYNPALPSNQLAPLVSTDLTGPAVGSKTVAPLAFYDSAAENLTITCAVTVMAPDGKSTVNLTATAPPINVLKPTATWGVDPKTVPANGTANSNQIGFHDDSATSQSYGVNTTWYPAKLSVPSPFSGGQGCFVQLVTPSATITRTATGKGVSTYSLKILNAQGTWIAPGTGLDGSFPYAFGFTTDANGNLTGIASDSSWQASGTGASGDNPKGQETTSDVDNGGIMWTSSSISDSFTTWLMYKPDGGVWIPVKSATWKASGNASGGPSNWSATGNYTAPSPMDAKDPPQWNVVISGQQYRP